MTCNCDTVLCAEHQQAFLDILADIPDRLATMAVTISKQAVMGGQGGKPTNDDDRPLPVHLGAVEAKVNLRAALVNTAVRVRHCFTEQPPQRTIGGVCQWLRHMMPRMIYHPEAIGWYQTIANAYATTTKMIDLPPERIRAGVCHCGETLYAYAGKEMVRCSVCHIPHYVEALQEAELAKVENYTGTAAEVLRVLHRAEIKIRLSRLTKWADRDKLTFTLNEDGSRIFRVGEVLEVYNKMTHA